MKRIFPAVIEAYDKLGDCCTPDDPDFYKAYLEYIKILPTFQEFFRCVSNKRAIEAGVKMGIVSASRKPANKKKIIILRKIMNLFRTIRTRAPKPTDPAPNWTSLCYGLLGNNKNGYPQGVWVEYLWNPLDVIAGSTLDIEDDDPYQLAVAIAELYRMERWDEFCELSKKYGTCRTK